MKVLDQPHAIYSLLQDFYNDFKAEFAKKIPLKYSKCQFNATKKTFYSVSKLKDLILCTFQKKYS